MKDHMDGDQTAFIEHLGNLFKLHLLEEESG